jgi:hypothetical protein
MIVWVVMIMLMGMRMIVWEVVIMSMGMGMRMFMRRVLMDPNFLPRSVDPNWSVSIAATAGTAHKIFFKN